MSPALTVSEDEMATALRIFAEAVGAVAGETIGTGTPGVEAVG
jgi:hypothetical protein